MRREEALKRAGRLALLLFVIFLSNAASAQLSVNITANRDSICFGDTTLLTANVPGLPTFNGSLTTTFANNNGQDGNMFAISAIQDVIITGFAHHPNAGTVPGHEIYYKTGSHVGFENTPGAWTLINTANNFPASPVGTPTNIPGTLNVFIPAGQTFSFYLTTTGHGVNYTNGTAVGSVYVQDANIRIREGTGNTYPFGTVYQPRIPNIVVYYRSPAQISYLWNTGDTTQNIIATASQTINQYSIQVTDSAGNVANDTITILGSNVIIDTIYDTICRGQLYNGVSYNTSTVLNSTYTAVTTGCDSLVTVFLEVLPTFSTGPHVVPLCFGDVFYGAPRFTNAPVVQFLTGSNGCDSTAVAIISIIQPTNNTQNISLCPGQAYNGVVYSGDTSLVYNDTSVITGCDSNTTINITFLPLIDTTLFDTVQAGNPYNGIVYLFDTLLVDTLVSAGGCDSIVRINLTVDGALITLLSDTICLGQTYQGIAYTADTILRDTLLSVGGADSLVITNLRVISIQVTVSNTICYGGLYRGFPRFTDTVFVDTYLSPSGCDSTVTDSLFVSPLITDTVYPIVCQGFTYLGYAPANDTVVSVLLTASNGCDSLLVADITVNDTFRLEVFDTICFGQSMFVGGALQTSSGRYVDVYPSANICDSTVVTNLFVRDTTLVVQNIGICDGQSYFAGGALQTTPGTYTDIYTDQFGCDSTVVTNLQINDTITIVFDPVICQGQSYFAGGANQTTTGTYTDFYITAAGCDSIVITNLTVNDTFQTLNPVAICEGQSFFAGGALQTVSGIYFDTLSSASACDSIIVTQLTVNDTSLTNIFDTICEGQSIFAGGSSQSTSGVYIDFLTNSSNCDSTVVTNLFVHDTTTLNRNDTICEGQSIFLGGANQTISGVYTDFYTDQNGCDSTVITTLFVIDTITTNIFDTICEGNSLFVGGANQTASGTYFDLYSAISGCDSLVVTNLTVLDTTHTINNVTICEGNFYFAGGVLQGSSGTYTDIYTDANGCDSTVITNLTVNDTTHTIVFDTICEGQTLFAGGANQSTTGVYIDILTDANNCDSTVFTNLYVHDTIETQIYDTICEGNSYLAGGALQTATGIYYDYLTDRNGCDSTIITHLYVHDTVVTNLSVQICEGQSHFAGGANQTISGIYTDLYTDVNGCDSFVITDLTVTDTTHTRLQVSICEGTSYFVGGANQTTAGVYSDILTDVNGCDSLIFTTLSVWDTTHTQIFDTICEGQSFLAGGAQQTTSGVYIDILTDVNGCDSTIFTNLWVHDTTIFNQAIQICEYDSFFAGGTYQNSSGTYTDIYTDRNGCDSIIITALTVTDTINFRRDIQICEGQSFFVGGANQSTSGTYLDQYLDQNGCDSLVITNLIVTDTTQTRRTVTICQGQSFFAGGGFQVNPGNYLDVLTDVNGCDSLLFTTLIVLPNSATTNNVNICVGDSYFAGGAFQTTSGIYYDTLGAANGCDSVVTTNLNVYHQTFNNIGVQNIDICAGDSFLAAGEYQTTTGVYFDTLYGQAWTGCDSFLRTNLTVNAHTGSSQSIYICQGDSYFVGGASQTTAGTYFDTLTNARGCDSVITTILTVKPLPNPTIIGPSSICGDQTAVLSIPDTFSSYLWVPGGQTTNSIVVNQQDNYTVTVTDQFGCTGTATTFNLTVIRDFITSLVPDSTVISITDSVQIDLTTSASSPTYLWYPNIELSCTQCEDPVAAPNIPYTYFVIVTDANGCRDTGRVRIEVINEEIFFVPNILVIGSNIDENNTIRVYGEGIDQVNWSIYNRWGERIFHTQDPNGYWDGTYKGDFVQPGVYSYSIEVMFEDGRVITPENQYRKGTITVVR